MATFRIATFSSDETQYTEMRASFAAAGFVEPHTIYERLSDSTEEPFGALTRLALASEPYVLLAHQDIRCDQGDGASDLIRVLAALDEADDRWEAAGVAGGSRHGELVRHVSDPWGTDWRSDLPVRVSTLDEALLVLRTAARPRCSSDLSGFHFYGADVCLNARRRGGHCYVVDFKVSHQSAGREPGRRAAASDFGQIWGRRFLVPFYVRMTWGFVPVARFRWMLRLMSIGRAQRYLHRILTT